MREFDCSGKSTVAQKLVKQFRATHIHTSKPKTKNPFYEYVQQLNDLDPNKNYVIDRFFHGERAYGPIYRKKDGLDDEKQLYLELMCQKHRCAVVYCWQSANELAWWFTRRGEPTTKLEDTPKLKMLYQKTLQKSILPVLEYRWTTQKYSELVSSIQFHTRNQASLDKNLNIPGFIGHPKPHILFIGDQPNAKLVKHRGFDSVFCSQSGMFLMSAIKKYRNCSMIINSTNLTIADIRDILPSRVVYLGQNAFKRMGKPWFGKTISHPSYAKRFYGKNALIKYQKEIQEACI